MWASLILGLAQLGYGAYQKGKAKKAYNSISDAPYNISQLYNDNVGLAENQAQTGFSADATNFYTEQLNQGLASTTNGILQAGGGANDFAKAYSNYTTGIKSFAVQDSTLKQSNIAKLIEARSALAREQTQQWAINKYQKMQDQKAAAALMLGNANTTMNQGLNTTVQGAAQLGQYYLSDKVPNTPTQPEQKQYEYNNYDAVNQYKDNSWYQQPVSNTSPYSDMFGFNQTPQLV